MPNFRHVGTDSAPASNQVIVANGAVADYYDANPEWQRADATDAEVTLGVDQLKGEALDDALKAAHLPTSGSADDKRARLTQPVTPDNQEK